MLLRRWLCIVFLFFSLPAGGAELPWGPTPAEMALLPEYCQVRAIDNQGSPAFRAWMQALAPKFLGIHHYCAGVNYINRYLHLVNDPKRKYYLSRAVPEIDYVAKDMPPNFPIAGEVYMHRGLANKLMKKEAAAASDFVKAIKHDPNQVRAYLYLSEIYAAAGNKDKALEFTTIALKRVPDSKTLQQRYLEYGGKKPFPQPDIAPTVPEERAAVPAQQESLPSDGEPRPSSQANGLALPEENEPKENESAEEAERPVIGVPGNPYCRFCP